MSFVADVVKSVGHVISSVSNVIAPVVKPIAQDVALVNAAQGDTNGAITGGVGQSSSSVLDTVGSIFNDVTNGVKTVLGTIQQAEADFLTPIKNAVSQITDVVKTINDGILKPLIDPIVNTYNAVNGLVNAIHTDLSQGILGVLKIPQQLADALTSVDASFARAIDQLGAANADIAKGILTPAILGAASESLKTLGLALTVAPPSATLDVGAVGHVRLTEPPSVEQLENFIALIKEKAGEAGNIAGAIFNILVNVAGAFTALLTYLVAKNKPYEDLGNIGAAAQKLDINSVLEAWSRQILSDADAANELAKYGLNESRRAVLFDLQNYLPSLELALLLWRRGLVSNEALNNIFDHYKLTADDKLALQASTFYLPSTADVSLWYIRKVIDQNGATKVLQDLGYTSAQIEAYLATLTQLDTPQDYINVYGRNVARADGLFRESFGSEPPNEAVQLGELNAIAADVVRSMWLAHWALPGIQSGIALFFRGLLSQTQLNDYLTALNVPVELQQSLVELERPLIPFRTVPAMLAAGVINEGEALDILQHHGYTQQDAERLIDFALKRGKSSKATTAGDLHALSVSIADTMFNDGILNQQQYVEVLTEHGFSTDAANLMVQLAQLKASTKERADAAAQIVAEVQLGLLQASDAQNLLFNANYTQAEVAKYLKQITAAIKSNAKQPSLSDLDKFFKKGLLDENGYLARAQSIGYSASDAQLFLQLLATK
jgi:hypothetical protein